MTQEASAAAGTAPPNAVNYTIGLLFTIYTLNYLDRQIVNILAEPIKRDLGLADWQLGMISGLAFALFYTTLGIPLAQWADRPANDRSRLISLSLATWSGMTMLCAGAANFVQMMLARIGVGVGEAGCSPAAHSLISDIVPAERRATALGIYSLGVPIGKLAGMVLGGWVAHHYGWRTAFLVVGAPGLLIALLAWSTMTDPRRTGAVSSAGSALTFPETWAALRKSPLFWLVTFACGLTAFIGLGMAAFVGSFVIRVHGLTVDQAGLYLGLCMGLAGALGSWLGGLICDRLGRRNPRLHMLLPGVAALGGGAFVTLGVFAGGLVQALALLSIAAFCFSFWYGPVFSAVQGVAPPSGRATAASIHLFVVNGIGFGLGPVTIGALSDAFSRAAPLGEMLGEADGLRWAIAVGALASLGSAALFFVAARHIAAPDGEAQPG